MVLSGTQIPKVLLIGALLVASLLIAGCTGIHPYEPLDHREEGPETGLFTGSEGEFIILRKTDEQQKGSKDRKNAGSAAQPESNSDHNGNVNEPLKDTPQAD